MYTFWSVCVSDEFWGLSKDQLVKLLWSEELRIEDEYQVFTAAMDWVLQVVAKRKKHGGGAGPSQVPPALPTEYIGGWVGSEMGKTMERLHLCDRGESVMRGWSCAQQRFTTPSPGRWSALPVMVTRRVQVGVACLNNCIYAVGGWNKALGSLKTVEKYSPKEKWVEVAPMAVARARRPCQLLTGCCTLCVCGGLQQTSQPP